MSDNTTRAQCIHCFNFLSASSNLRSHFTHPHCEALKTVPEPRQQSMGRDGSVFVYNPDYLREQFAGLMIQRGLPFSHFETMLKDVFKSGGRNYKHYVRICKDAEKLAYLPNWDVPTRWNSTYHMFQCGLKQKATLIYFHEYLVNRGDCQPFDVENWVIIESICPLLKVFNNATKILSRVYYSTSPLVLQQIYFMSNKLTEYELNGGIFSSMVKPMKAKLKKYFQKIPPIITCATALNQCFNVHGVELLIESISTDLEFLNDVHETRTKHGSTNL
ncbi:zinc finger BED domain-containing protein RICESLEEPER 2-like protein [Tanacetum coccineum]